MRIVKDCLCSYNTLLGCRIQNKSSNMSEGGMTLDIPMWAKLLASQPPTRWLCPHSTVVRPLTIPWSFDRHFLCTHSGQGPTVLGPPSPGEEAVTGHTSTVCGRHRVLGEVTKSFRIGVIPVRVWRLSRK